jgi:hypothetical protein
MTKTPPKTKKDNKLDLVIRNLEKKVDQSTSQSGGSCARVYCI